MGRLRSVLIRPYPVSYKPLLLLLFAFLSNGSDNNSRYIYVVSVLWNILSFPSFLLPVFYIHFGFLPRFGTFCLSYFWVVPFFPTAEALFFLSCCLSFTSLALGQGALIFISSFCWQTPSPRATEFAPFGCPAVHIVRPRLRQFGSTVRVRSNTLHLLSSPGYRAHQRGRQPALIAHPLASPF